MDIRQWVAIGIGGVLLGVLAKNPGAPVRWLLRVAVNALVGALAIWIWDRGFGNTGIVIGVNPVTAVTTGVLGLPGFGLLLALKVGL